MTTASRQYHINPNDFIDKRHINAGPSMYRDLHGHRRPVPHGMKIVRNFSAPWPSITRGESGDPVIKPHGQMSDAWWASDKKFHGQKM